MTYAELEAGGGSPIELYRFVYGDSEWRWTSGDTAFELDGGTFFPKVITRGSIGADEESHAGSADITVDAENEVALLFAAALPTTPVLVTIWRAQREDEDAEAAVIFSGQVKSCTFTRHAGALHCVPMQDVVNRRLPQMQYQTTCNNMLFDQRCQVARGDFTYEYALENIEAPSSSGEFGPRYTLEDAAAAAFYDDTEKILEGGTVQLGDEKQTITFHQGATISTLAPIKGAIIGSVVTLTAGCPKTIDVCRDRFDNLERFNGFPHIPARNPFAAGGLS